MSKRMTFGTFIAPYHPVGEHPVLMLQRDLARERNKLRVFHAQVPRLHPRSLATSPGRAASPLTLQKPCQAKKPNDLNDVALLPGSVRQVHAFLGQEQPGNFCRLGTSW